MDDHEWKWLADVVDVCAGTEFADPYRRLEDETRGVLEWQRERDAETQDAIAAIGSLDGLIQSLNRHLTASAVTTPKRGGNRWFWHERNVMGDNAALAFSSELTGPRQRLFAASQFTDGEQPAIDWFFPSPDGRWVAVGVSANGDEQSVLHVVDANDGSVVPPRINHASGGRVAWLPDGRGFYCCAGTAADTERPVKELFLVYPGLPAAQRVPTPERDFLDSHLMVQVSDDGRYVGLAANPWCPRLCFVLDRRLGRWHEAFPVDEGEVFHGVFAAGRYLAVTTHDAPKGRVVAAPVESPADQSTWVEVMSSGSGVIRGIVAAGSHVCVCEYVRGDLRLWLVDPDGREKHRIDMPTPGAAGSRLEWAQVGTEVPVEITKRKIVLVYSTPSCAPGIHTIDIATRQLTPLTTPRFLPKTIQADSHVCHSADGYPVTFDMHRQRDGCVSSPSPTLIAAYGGWNSSWSAKGYLGMFAPFVEAGGTFVFAHLRGDGTFGADHWRGGRRNAKQRTFDDLYAVAEHLIAERVTAADRLALYGASNGGLLGGVAITQRPELFRAVVTLVPLFDMCRASRERFAELYSWEYGDPRLPEHASWIRAYSPYHNVRPGTRGPATMIVCGSRDIRTHPWHGRKMTAALHAANPDGRRVHLRVHEARGHFTASTQASPRIIAEWLAFVMHEVGLPLPSREQIAAPIATAPPTG